MLHDSGPVHSAMITKHFMVNCGKVEICHLLYSPEWTVANLLICPEIKTVLKGRWIQDVKGIKKDVAIICNAVNFNVFYDCFMQLLKYSWPVLQDLAEIPDDSAKQLSVEPLAWEICPWALF